VRDADHQDIDRLGAKIPLCAVYGDLVGSLLRKQTQKKTPERHRVEVVFAEETLNAPVVGRGLDTGFERYGNATQVRSRHHQDGRGETSHEL
jgi:hypothetical protein